MVPHSVIGEPSTIVIPCVPLSPTLPTVPVQVVLAFQAVLQTSLTPSIVPHALALNARPAVLTVPVQVVFASHDLAQL